MTAPPTTLSLPAFLERCLAAEEARALAATPGPWVVEKTSSHMDPATWGLEIERWRGYRNMVGLGEDKPTAAHIAANDPASTLRRVEAHRKILALHQPFRECFDDGYALACPTCLTDRSGFRDEWEADRYPCPTLRTLAAVYADEPGWSEAWR